jgi:hypothetical protein
VCVCVVCVCVCCVWVRACVQFVAITRFFSHLTPQSVWLNCDGFHRSFVAAERTLDLEFSSQVERDFVLQNARILWQHVRGKPQKAELVVPPVVGMHVYMVRYELWLLFLLSQSTSCLLVWSHVTMVRICLWSVWFHSDDRIAQQAQQNQQLHLGCWCCSLFYRPVFWGHYSLFAAVQVFTWVQSVECVCVCVCVCVSIRRCHAFECNWFC